MAENKVTTEDMKLALLEDFRFRLQFPLVVTECQIGYYLADILAIKKSIAVEIEIKQRFIEIIQDLGRKWNKHAGYLHSDFTKPKPNKFHFVLPSISQYDKKTRLWEIPKPYGLIIVKKLYDLAIIKSAHYLTRNNAHLDKLTEALTKRLTAENINLRSKMKGVRNG